MKRLTRKRGHQFVVMLSEEENEFLARRAAEDGISANALMRSRVFRGRWRTELEDLRIAQNCELRDLDIRRK